MSARRRDEAPTEEIGHGESYLPFVVMEDLLDKLKIISYDTEFSNEFNIKPVSRHYFSVQTNPGEQFFIFSSLAAWLIQKCGILFETPQEESNDPNTTISNILDVLRNMGTAVDIPPSKLKQGWGEQVIFVLDHLADMTLKKKGFTWKMLISPEGRQEEEITVEDSVEVTLEKIEEEMMEEGADGDDNDDEGPVMDLDTLKSQTHSCLFRGSFKPVEVMQSSVDSADWTLEVERVLPQLKVTIHPDSKDWRSHLDQLKQYRKDMGESMTATKTQLDRLSADMNSAVGKASSREKYLTAQLESLLLEYRAAREMLARAKEQYRLVSKGVTARSCHLAQISEELEQMKQEMEERGSSMTDGTPLVQVRKALRRLKTEASQMDVRIGVALHTLLQAKLREKGSLCVTSDAPATTEINFVF